MIKTETVKKAKQRVNAVPQNGQATGIRLSDEEIQFIADRIYKLMSKDGPGPIRRPGETEEQMEKRLAKLRSKTLKAFQMAYESHQRQQAVE